MPGSVLNLSNAYDDSPLQVEESLSLPKARLTDSSRSPSGSIGWERPPPFSSRLKLLDRPFSSEHEGSGHTRTGRLPLPDTSYRRASPPPDYTPRKALDTPTPFPINPKTPYEVLGVSEYATQDEIKKAYKRLALAFHPDRCHGNEAEIEEATKRFKLIAEAYAILGLPERRAEYNIARRERTRGTTASPGHPKASSNAAFKSSFMPAGSRTPPSWNTDDDGDPTLQDLRYLDPFSLFASMFPQYARQFGPNGRFTGGNFEGRGGAFPSYGDSQAHENANGFLDDPLVARPYATGARKNNPSQFRTVTERQEKAHMDRKGRLEVSQSQRTMKVHKSGGFTYSSSSFSGSFGPGSGSMLAALISGGMSSASTGDEGFGSASSGMQSMLGMPDFSSVSVPSHSRSRRTSGGALDDHMRPSISGPRHSSRSLVRRPSFDQPLPYTHSPSLAGIENEHSLGPFSGHGRDDAIYRDW